MLLSPAGSVAQPEQSVRRVQLQERVGVHVCCTGAPEVLQGKCSECVRESTHMPFLGIERASTSACVCTCVWPLMLIDAAAHT